MSDYKRLTKIIDGAWELGRCNSCDHCGVAYCEDAQDAIERLAELEDKIEDGTLRFLPCKTGDKVYMPWEYNGVNDIAELTVKRISVDEKCIDTNLKSDVFDYFRKYDFGVFMFDEIGAKVFLTKPEAEAKLKELKGEV